MVEINKFELEFDKEQIEDLKEYTENILTNDSPISNGTYVKEFEDAFSDTFDLDDCLAVNSGTSALEVALRSIDIEDKNVFFPVNTMIGTYIAILRAGGIPIPVDISPSTLAMNVRDIFNIRNRWNTAMYDSVLLLVHIGGSISRDTSELVKLAEDKGMTIVEDAAQAHDATYKNFKAGMIGDVGCFSFSATKPMTTAEGGMCSFSDDYYYERAKAIRNFGSIDDPHSHELMGGNFKMTELSAALGLTELSRVKKRIKKRSILGDIYHQELDETIYIPHHMGDGSHYKKIVRFYGDRQDLYEHCRDFHVYMTGEVYPIPLNKQPIIEESNNRYFNRRFKGADTFCDTHICPPNYPELTIANVEYVREVLNSYDN